jgi:low temperature requirement protein LtrA
MQDQAAEPQETMRVSTIELFFDLVFVFTITQVTHLVEHAHRPLDFLLALLVLMLIWWMYAGYAWLTNAVGAETTMRLVLIAAMAAFLVMALAIPGIFDMDGLVFGIAYLFVVLLHLAAFYVRGGPGTMRAILGLAPFNVGASLLVIAAGVIDAEWDWIFYLIAPALFVLTTIFRRYRGFAVNPSYFAERHGLVIILALGESVIAIGTGAADRALDLETIVAIVLSLVFLATLWWSYFDRDDVRAEHALVSASQEERARMALLGYWYAHLAMIFGIVLIATAIKQVVAHGEGPVESAAWLLAGGLAVYLAGDVFFRWVVGIGPLTVRAVGAIIALALAIAGLQWGGVTELGAMTALMVVLLAVEQRGGRMSKSHAG